GEMGIRMLDIRWPDGGRQIVRDLRAGRRYVIKREEAALEEGAVTNQSPLARFVWQGSELGEAPGTAPRSRPERGGALYPFKAIPGAPQPRMLRADFDEDGREDVFILRDWEAPRLILSGGGTMKEASEERNVAEFNGIWEV